MPKPKPSPLPLPEAPADLSERSKQLWSERCPRRPEDVARRALFLEGLRSLDRADAARRQIADQGMVFVSQKTGVAHASPLLKIERDARMQFSKIWQQLGLAAHKTVRTDAFGRRLSEEE